MINHKDGSPGARGCDRFDSRAACPECNRADACTVIEEGVIYLRRLEMRSSDVEPIIRELKKLYHAVSRLTWDKLKKETEARP